MELLFFPIIACDSIEVLTALVAPFGENIFRMSGLLNPKSSEKRHFFGFTMFILFAYAMLFSGVWWGIELVKPPPSEEKWRWHLYHRAVACVRVLTIMSLFENCTLKAWHQNSLRINRDLTSWEGVLKVWHQIYCELIVMWPHGRGV